MLVRVAVLVVFGSIELACTEANPLSCFDGYCSDQAHPFCDVDGSIGGTPGQCLAVECTAREFFACRSDEALVCNATGDSYDEVSCSFGCGATGCFACAPHSLSCDGPSLELCGNDGAPETSTVCDLGCVSEPTAHCAHLEPKFIPNACDDDASEDLEPTASLTLDTSLNSNCTGGVIAQSGGPEICVARYRMISIGRNVDITVTGSRVLALVSDEALEVEGVLDVSANGRTNGPGAVLVPANDGGGGRIGGGGAGFKTPGGHGGDGNSNGGAANGGAAVGGPAVSTIITGGFRAGTTFGGNQGGGGGGAVLLISCRGRVAVSGLIDAGGGGGAGAMENIGLGGYMGAGGGGAGGTIVIQGREIQITGQLFANGGGAGSGQDSPSSFANPGKDGNRSLVPAQGGTATGTEGAGGTGGVGQLSPGVGGKANSLSSSGGGGGGSVGFIQTYTPDGSSPVLAPTAISPPFESNQTVLTR